MLLAITPVIGLSRAVGAAPDLATALGYDIEAALDDRWLLTAPSPVSCDLTAAAARSAATSPAPVVVAWAGAGVELLADAQRPQAVAETAAEGFIGPGVLSWLESATSRGPRGELVDQRAPRRAR